MPDELDLEAETVEDLPVEEEQGRQVRGGRTTACAKGLNMNTTEWN